jgi:FkbM family methyltransferase
MYRTGDMGRWTESGELEYLGRVDNQVKVRGYRVELGEVESQLRILQGVKEAVVVARLNEQAEKSLVAYVVPQPSCAPIIRGRKRYALPNGMAIVHHNKHETDFSYREIFERQNYLKHGIEIGEDACVFDVGANIGMFTMFISRHYPATHLYAFEPIGPVFETLKLNTELYGESVKLFQTGLSNEERTETFTFYPRQTMMSGLSSYSDSANELEVTRRYLLQEMRGGAEGAPLTDKLSQQVEELLVGSFEGEAHHARLRKLSDVIREERIDQIDLLKVDVQRSELDVLMGIEAADWKKIRQVVMEVHEIDSSDGMGRIAQVRSLLEKHGFEVVVEQEEILRGTDRHNLYASRRREGKQEAPKRRHSDDALRPHLAPLPPIISSSQLKAALRETLPEHMVPSAIVILEELPLTPNGKVDRHALPEPGQTNSESNDSFVAPRTEIEKDLANIWAELLKVERVGVKDNFFDLGGHSLLATRLVSQIREFFQIELALRTVFESPTVAGLAEAIVHSLLGPHSDEEMEQMLAELEQLTEAEMKEMLRDN